MFSFSSKSDQKKGGNHPISSADRKKAKQFSKGVNRFLRYNKDLLPAITYNNVVEMRDQFNAAAGNPAKKRRDLDDLADGISKVCKKAKPDFQPSLLKENIEVLFVAVVIAMGIRAYFIQQFKIPTGSMQPTLNGIVAYPAPEIPSLDEKYKAPEGYTRPNAVRRLVESVWFGRSHVEWRAKEDGDYINRDAIEGKSMLILFPRTYMTTAKGHKYVASGTRNRVEQLLNLNILRKRSFTKGDILARGYLETGDMLIVNKMIYHWAKPKRGNVFVFVTRGITKIEKRGDFNKNFGSQHYIKRLCGVPGDKLKIEPPKLLVNGEPAKEFGIRRVMAAEGLYDGYVLDTGYRSEFDLGPTEYVALGDNSKSSFDSRGWGTVPAPNIVGRAMFVFYPFGNHFGPIR